MKLVYWISEIDDDDKCYNIRGKTKKSVVDQLESLHGQDERFSKPRRVTVEYANAMDLVRQCLGEVGAQWEYETTFLKIRIINYPLDSEFFIEGELPAFEYACPERNKYLHEHLKSVSYNAPHEATDFSVENIEVRKDGEDWHLGS